MRRRESNSFLAVSLAPPLFKSAALAARPARKILVIGDLHRKIYRHGAVSHAMATIFDLGCKSGLCDAYIRTGIQLLAKQALAFAQTITVPDVNGNDGQ